MKTNTVYKLQANIELLQKELNALHAQEQSSNMLGQFRTRGVTRSQPSWWLAGNGKTNQITK